MKTQNPPTTHVVSLDEDMVQQANPGQGIPSQDPSAAAQSVLTPHEAEREKHTALVGGGVAAGATTGALVGAAVAGPAGSLAGATLGAIAGALGGAAAGANTEINDNDGRAKSLVDSAGRPD